MNAIIDGIDAAALQELKLRYPSMSSTKYLNLRHYVPRNVRFCARVGLIDSAPKSILDVGCGTGLFLKCAQHFGHNGIGIDQTHPFYADAAALYGIDRRIVPVRPFEPIAIDGKFDVVTGIAISFDKYRMPDSKLRTHWGSAEWQYFLSDIRTRLNPDGKVFLVLNKRDEAFFQLAVTLESNEERRVFLDAEGLNRAIEQLARTTGEARRPISFS